MNVSEPYKRNKNSLSVSLSVTKIAVKVKVKVYTTVCVMETAKDSRIERRLISRFI